MDISIIVPVYNVEEYIERCIQSLVSQSTNFTYEILLIDDGSKDASGAICDKFANKIVRVFHQENSGVSVARNVGIENARGRYLCFVDSDDFLDEHFIDVMVKKAIETDADIVKCEYYEYYGNQNLQTRQPSARPARRFSALKPFYDSPLGEDMMLLAYVCCAVYKREMWENVRFPKGFIYEDMMVAHLIFYPAKSFAYIDEPLYYYRQDNINSATHTGGRATARPKQLDQVFLAYATLEFMYQSDIDVDYTILQLTIREMGRMAITRINSAYHPLAFKLGCYTVQKLVERLEPGYAGELSKTERLYTQAFLNGNYSMWKALGYMSRWGQ